MNEPRLPLPLELTRPVLLAGDLNTRLREALTSAYDAKIQMCSRTSSEMHCRSYDSHGAQVDVTVDIQVDDVIA